MGKLVLGLWDCPYCGTTGISGDITECPNCARARHENTKFYLPETIKYLPEEKANKVNRNPDWVCPYCNSLNSDSLHTCAYCGADRTAENRNYFTRTNSSPKTSTTHTENTKPQPAMQNTYHRADTYSSRSTYYEKSSRGFNIHSIIAFFLIAALIVGMVYVLIPKNEKITITQFAWERSIEIQRYQPVNESDWSLPENARLQYTKQEFHHNDKILDHYETKSKSVPIKKFSHYETEVVGYRDLGNGYFEEITSQVPVYDTEYVTETYEEPVYRYEPVYATKYYYEIDKWLYERTVKTHANDHTPYWGETNLKSDERVSHKSENYTITGQTSKNKVRTVSLEYSVWVKLSINQEVKLKISIFGNGKLIE